MQALELDVIKEAPVRRKYILEVKPNISPDPGLQKAVIFAQKQLMDEMEQNGYNVLLSERFVDFDPLNYAFFLKPSNSWQATLLRKGKLYRVDVEYHGWRMQFSTPLLIYPLLNPSLAARANFARPRRQPPYIAILKDMNHYAPALSISNKAGGSDERRLCKRRSWRIVVRALIKA